MDNYKPPRVPRLHLKATLTLLLAGSATTAGVVYQSSHNEVSSACVCGDTTVYNPSLPASHPANRCATQRQGLSWQSWLSGSSRNSQFHFLDLLELLNGNDSTPRQGQSSNNQP